MSVLWSAPVCGLATFTCLRWTAIPWNAVVALVLVVSPFEPLGAVGAALGVALALALGGRSRRLRAVAAEGLAIGHDRYGRVLRIPLRERSGAHTLVVGATGSGKTVTEAWVLARAIDHGHGAVIIDPKGDALLHREARAAALRGGRRFVEWTPGGPAIYNPYAHGSPSEIADKALAGEPYSEPH
jgi:DNA helicase HerA-like ATPase